MGPSSASMKPGPYHKPFSVCNEAALPSSARHREWHWMNPSLAIISCLAYNCLGRDLMDGCQTFELFIEGDQPAMSNNHTLALPSVPAIQTRPASALITRALLMLSAVLLSWGCAGHKGNAQSTIRCPNTVQAKVSPTKPTVSVSYTEPSVSVAGGSLADLAKTTIYYDLGNGRTLAKEIPASKATGGGQVSQTITIPIRATGEESVRICVTATDRHGNESAMTP